MKAFEIKKTYAMRSVCDHNCIWSFEVTRRTDKSVWLKGRDGNEKRCSIRVWDDVEAVYPLGKYSMAPVLTAEKVAA